MSSDIGYYAAVTSSNTAPIRLKTTVFPIRSIIYLTYIKFISERSAYVKVAIFYPTRIGTADKSDVIGI